MYFTLFNILLLFFLVKGILFCVVLSINKQQIQGINMKKNMMSILLASFILIGFSSFITSCSDDSCVTPTETAIIENTDGIDFDAVYASIFPSEDDVISQDGPPVRGGGPGKRDTVRGGGRDSVNNPISRPMPWQSVLPCLKLTPEQQAQLREFSMAQRECEKGAREQFKAVLDPLRRAQRTEMEAIRAELKSGAITRQEANAKIRALNERMKNATKEAEVKVREAIKACMDRFFARFESIMTPEQLALWNEWKRTGKSPCARNPIGTRP
jgi:Spy/CpxP family protein refolding chaperone